MTNLTPSDATTRFLLGVIVTTGFFATVFVVLFIPVPTGVRDIVLVLLGALIASFKEVTGFFFGSSAGSAAKDVALQAAASAAIPPPVVNVIATPTALEPLEAAIAAQATPAPPPRASASATPPIAPAVPTLTDVLP